MLMALSTPPGWHLGINDPTIEAWIIVAAYALAAFASARAAMAAAGRESVFWWSVAVLMSVLCLNKQLDVQSLVTQYGREIAREQGWMDYKRALQLWFVLSVAGGMLLAMGGICWFMRALLWRLRIALIGLVLIAGFVLTRAVSFHHLEIFLGRSIDPAGVLRFNILFELPGILLVACSAWFRRNQRAVSSSDHPLPEARHHADP
ncbi:MAG: hypothetical protein RLN76_03500 [Phycisphaeraceae bacterium]